MPKVESYLEEGKSYSALSINDLLEARDAYHVFLTRKKNVIGTAVGKYRFRKKNVSVSEAKSLENTEVRSYSWPCILVFVDEWIASHSFGQEKGETLDNYLPRRLYLKDGREIPVCVLKVEWQRKPSEPIASMRFPGSLIGGGYPICTRVQGEERWATMGCLVSDGRLTYALTNSHVIGKGGESVFTYKNAKEVELGIASEKRLLKQSFTEVYENLPGTHTMVNLDIGLIELDNLHNVTSQIYGVGEVRGILDVNHDTLSLKLVGCPVIGYGSASGIMQGEIIALFYRYTCLGGYDYVADYLVGPRAAGKSQQSHFAPTNGDSGTLLVVDSTGSEEDRKAIGILWGGQKSVTGDHVQPYALVTNLGTICRQLDIELKCTWNTGHDRYFGAYAHVVLPSLCASVVNDHFLRQLMTNNIDRISMPLDETEPKQAQGLSKAAFVPLADVPDLVWKMRGGKYLRGKEGSNHFADMDQIDPTTKKTLLQICSDPKNIEPEVWAQYYRNVKAEDHGALPFRIAQIFDAMKGFAHNGQKAEYVAAAGILTHYVFDACMPLHISYMHHGDPNGKMKTIVEQGKEKEVPLAYDVHAEFDNDMVEYFVADVRKRLPKLVIEAAKKNKPTSLVELQTTKDAAVAAVKLMMDTFALAPAQAIVKDYEKLVDVPKRARCEALWQQYGDGMLHAMAEGVVLASRLWEAAWVNGNGVNKISENSAVPEDELRALYQTKTGFLDSLNLDEITKNISWP